MNIISLFSGAGGLDLGMIMAGHEVIWANDHDADAVDTYRKNIGDHIVCGDIEKIEINSIPDADVVIGGFPCQGFSLANQKREVTDERNILYKYFKQVIENKKPKYFLAENVRGILSLGGGKVIEKIVKDFEKAGYNVKVKVFNVADFGVPQTRIRVIIAGTRNDLPPELEYQFPKETHTKKVDESQLKPWVSIGEALGDIPDPDVFPDAYPNQIYSKYKVTNRNFTGHRTTDPTKPSPTILARGNGKGGVCAIQHPENLRRMSVRESASVQTFPLNFEFTGAMNSCYRQVGNAVPVLFAKCLGLQLRLLEPIIFQDCKKVESDLQKTKKKLRKEKVCA
ncbi:DNA cytosine methyltransferase [Undibacterium sp. MH2W]|uniref:DNA cytosine methyltransferase n=1 Tax=Undibacterium sp. MH2W TaxID=3413044 RepID=UPI003BF02540